MLTTLLEQYSFLAYVFLVVGFVFLIKGGDWFVDAATGIAKRFHLPELLIGATVVSIGTTLPEVMTSAMGAAAGSGKTRSDLRRYVQSADRSAVYEGEGAYFIGCSR